MSESQELSKLEGQPPVKPTEPSELSFWDLLKQRFLHPFLGWFSTSFILWNWKAFLMLIWSKRPIEEVIISVEIYFRLGSAWNFIAPIMIGAFLGVALTPIGSLFASGSHILEGFVEAIQTKAILLRLPYSIARESADEELKRRRESEKKQQDLSLQVKRQAILIEQLRGTILANQTELARLSSLTLSLESENGGLRKERAELETSRDDWKNHCEMALGKAHAADTALAEVSKELETAYLAYLGLRAVMLVAAGDAQRTGHVAIHHKLSRTPNAPLHQTIMAAAQNFLTRRGVAVPS